MLGTYFRCEIFSTQQVSGLPHGTPALTSAFVGFAHSAHSYALMKKDLGLVKMPASILKVNWLTYSIVVSSESLRISIGVHA